MENARIIDLDSPEVRYLCERDKRLARAIRLVGPITYWIYDDEYKFLVRSIISQMISGRAAEKIMGRLETACDSHVTPDAIDALSDDDLRNVGLSRPKIAYLRGLNEALESKDLEFDELRRLSDEDVVKRLTALNGVGQWTATIYLVFMLGRPDVAAPYDRCFQAAFRWLYETDDASVRAVKQRAKMWSPYASIVTRYFYQFLDLGLTKQKLSEWER